MTLLIALMLNYGITQYTGEQYINDFWIFAIWLLHLSYHNISKR